MASLIRASGDTQGNKNMPQAQDLGEAYHLGISARQGFEALQTVRCLLPPMQR